MSWAKLSMPVIPETRDADAGGLQVGDRPQQFIEALGNLGGPCLGVKNKGG